MSKAREKMKESLIEWVVPYLIANGFRGRFPHYRRIKEDQMDLIMFQFTYFDEAFCINLAKCPSTGIILRKDEVIPPEKVNVFQCNHKLVLGSEGQGSYHWFKYNPRQHELNRGESYSFLTMYKDSLLKYKQIADDITQLIKTQGEDWWGEPLSVDEEKVPTNNIFLEIQRLIGNL